jgi:hypothetical protein
VTLTVHCGTIRRWVSFVAKITAQARRHPERASRESTGPGSPIFRKVDPHASDRFGVVSVIVTPRGGRFLATQLSAGFS